VSVPAEVLDVAQTAPDSPATPAQETTMEALIAALVALGWTEEAAKLAAPKLADAKAMQEKAPEVEIEDEAGAEKGGEAPDYKAMYEDAMKALDAMKAESASMVKADSIPALVADLTAVRAVATGWGVEHGDHAADKLRAAVVEKAKPGALRKDASAAEVRAAFAMLPASPSTHSPWSAVTAGRTDAAPAPKVEGGFTMKIGETAGQESK